MPPDPTGAPFRSGGRVTSPASRDGDRARRSPPLCWSRASREPAEPAVSPRARASRGGPPPAVGPPPLTSATTRITSTIAATTVTATASSPGPGRRGGAGAVKRAYSLPASPSMSDTGARSPVSRARSTEDASRATCPSSRSPTELGPLPGPGRCTCAIGRPAISSSYASTAGFSIPCRRSSSKLTSAPPAASRISTSRDCSSSRGRTSGCLSLKPLSVAAIPRT